MLLKAKVFIVEWKVAFVQCPLTRWTNGERERKHKSLLIIKQNESLSSKFPIKHYYFKICPIMRKEMESIWNQYLYSLVIFIFYFTQNYIRYLNEWTAHRPLPKSRWQFSFPCEFISYRIRFTLFKLNNRRWFFKSIQIPNRNSRIDITLGHFCFKIFQSKAWKKRDRASSDFTGKMLFTCSDIVSQKILT